MGYDHMELEPGPPAAVPVWFGPSDRPRFGWWHAPGAGAGGSAAVLCPPLGRDALKTYFSYRVLAEQLARRGVGALRFDYDGTGDSAGGPEDPGRLEAWLASTADALGLVRSFGATRLSLIGTAIGGTIAAHAAAADGNIDRLVLWDAATSGSLYLRKHAALTSLRFNLPAKRDDGSIETPGFVYAATVVEDLKRLRLDVFEGPVADSVLVLSRPGAGRPEAATRDLARRAVDYGFCPGQAQLIDTEPPLQRVPHDDIEGIAEWVAAGNDPAGASVPMVCEPTSREAVVARTESGLEIRETALSIPTAGLLAIATSAPSAAAGRPVVVFLNSSDEHHIGPNRMWVDLARHWAALGFDSIRVDLSGLGDSPVRHPEQKQLVLRAPEAFDDLEDIVRTASDGGTRPVVLVGLCSSGYIAAESALTLHPAGVVLINPVTLFAPPETLDGGPVDPRRVIAQTRSLQAWERGDEVIERRAVATSLKRYVRRSTRLSGLAEWLVDCNSEIRWRVSYLLQQTRRPRTWCRLLVEGGTDVLLIAGDDDDVLLRYDLSDRVLAALAATGEFRYEHVGGLDHGVARAAQGRVIRELVTEHLVKRFSTTDSPDGIHGDVQGVGAGAESCRP